MTEPQEPVWIEHRVVLAVHDEQISEHGGGSGLRDEGLLESALARPVNQFTRGGAEPDLALLAATYAFGIARNHPFVDGNKRTAAVVMELFLFLNGMSMTANDAEIVVTFFALAAGELEEAVLADWIRDTMTKESP